MTLAEFRRVYPTAAFTVSSGKLFTYRYYQNPQAKATLVLLTGGIGLSDLFYKHFARFARDFSVLTFDYQLQFGDNGEFADAVAELLRHLKEKVWLVGQSLGGVVAQVIASRHPEVVEGLVLSNTCSLSGNMSKAGYQDLMKIIESQRKFKKWLAFLPFPLIKRMMRWAVMKKKTDGFTAQEKAAMEELCGAMMELLTKTKKGARQIPMSEKVYQALKRAVKNRGKAAPVNIGGYTNFLFHNQSGLPKTASCYESMFQGLVRKYNKHHKPEEALPNITPHTMRHTFCTRLAHAGMNPKDLQYIMGHSNITMTLNYYAHADYTSAKAAMDRLAA